MRAGARERDTCPNAEDIQTLFLYQVSTGARFDVVKFHHDPEQPGHIRCDLRLCWSRDGRTVCVDSTQTGERQMYLVDVSPITHG